MSPKASHAHAVQFISPSSTPRRRKKSLLGLFTLAGAALVVLHMAGRWQTVSHLSSHVSTSQHTSPVSEGLPFPSQPKAGTSAAAKFLMSKPDFLTEISSSSSSASCELVSSQNFNATSRIRRPVWWMGPFFSGTGYGSEALDFVLAMHRSNLFSPRSLWISQHGDHPKPLASLGLTSNDLEDLSDMHSAVCPTSPAIIICHSTATNWHQGSIAEGEQPCPPNGTYQYSYLIGRTMFETDRLPASFIQQSKRMNEIWVPTQFARGIFIKAGLSPEHVFVLGEPINTTFFDPALYQPIRLPFGQLILGTPKSIPPQQQLQPQPQPQVQSGNPRQLTGPPPTAGARRPFVFLTNFKFEPRKGWDVLLAAYLLAFKATDPVELYIITKPFVQNVNMNDFVKLTALAIMNKIHGEGRQNLAAMPTVYLDTSYIPKDVLPQYYRAADAFVLPSRGEGWGRPHVEAMAMGLPLLATNWSGPTEFLDDSVGYPIRVDGLVDADPSNGELFRGHKWAQPSIAHLSQLLRHVVAHPGEAAAKGYAARQRMLQRYSPQALAGAVQRQLQRVDFLLGDRYGESLVPKAQKEQQQQQQQRLRKVKRKFPWKIKSVS